MLVECILEAFLLIFFPFWEGLLVRIEPTMDMTSSKYLFTQKEVSP